MRIGSHGARGPAGVGVLVTMALALWQMPGASHVQAQSAQSLPTVTVTAPAKKPAAKKASPAVSKAAPAPAPAASAPAKVPPAVGATAANGPTGPVDARQMLPDDPQNLAGSGARVTPEDLEQQRPLTNHEALQRVPGIVTVADDGFARHGGIGVRGSPFRRSRKTLVMEDGVPINFSTYLDASTHYTPPMERVESIEVFKGPIVSYGPLNNHGVINFRNLSPFGPDETVLKAGIGTTEGADLDYNNFRHAHTRQMLGNVGIVASYSGMDAGGSWDVEKLGYNDFYAAIGFRGLNQDLTVSGGYFRQRDRYDEDNFAGPLADFNKFGHNKKAGADAGHFELAGCGACYEWSSYNADFYRLQVAHNLYINENTTLSTRLYSNYHNRARFFVTDDGLVTNPDNLPTSFFMEGRDRLYRNYGADSRIEVANLPLVAGLTHTLQAGVRYEEHFFDNRDRKGGLNQRLNFRNRGGVEEKQNLEAQSLAAFAQSAIKATPSLTVIPGVRFETYGIEFRNPDDPGLDGSADYTHVLPMLSFAWNAALRTTVYGGYHRGLAPHLVRDVLDSGATAFVPPLEEVGDNFQLGVRTKVVRGLTLDLAFFHNRIDNYQFGEAFQSPTGDRVLSSLDEVAFNGVEIFSRLDSNPFTGGPWNVFGEAAYTFVDSEIKKGQAEDGPNLVDVSGNAVPESIRHFANLTLGVEHKAGWNASLTWTYRGAYFTDAHNLPVNPADVEEGEVPDVWLVSARANYKLTDQLTLWASGHNLTDEFYITDRSDGARPGLGRTVMGGFTLRFD